MSSPPIFDVGIAAGGAASVRALRSPAGLGRDPAEDPAMVNGATAYTEDHLAVGLTRADSRQSGNIIGLETPWMRRAGLPGGSTRPRIDPRGVALAVRLADALLIAAAGIAAYWLQPTFNWPLDLTTAFTALAVMAMLVRSPDAEPRLLHDALRRPLARQLADAALRTLAPFALSLALIVTLVPADNLARAILTYWLTAWAFGAVGGICLVRLSLAGMIVHWRRDGRLKQAVAIFGTGDLAERLLDRLRAASPDAIELIGVFDDRARRRIASPGLRSLTVGGSDDLIALSRHRGIDRVLVALPHAAEQRVVEVLNKLRQMPVEISLAPDMVGYNLPYKESDELGGLPLLEMHGQPLTFGQVLLKGLLDKVLAATLLLLGSPLLLAATIAIKLDSRGPVLFRQNRHGFGDRVIGVYKFRTMAAAAADHNGESQASADDPRITRVGRRLRRWSIDELPQLINVLRGEMSLVGPRPHAISMCVEDRPNRDIVPDYALRHHVKPGITGWAQVNGYHGPVATEEALRARIQHDLEYINNWSFWFDFHILLRTIRIVLGQRHAY